MGFGRGRSKFLPAIKRAGSHIILTYFGTRIATTCADRARLLHSARKRHYLALEASRSRLQQPRGSRRYRLSDHRWADVQRRTPASMSL